MAKAEEEEGFIHVHFALTSQYPVSQNSFGIDHGVMRYALWLRIQSQSHAQPQKRQRIPIHVE